MRPLIVRAVFEATETTTLLDDRLTGPFQVFVPLAALSVPARASDCGTATLLARVRAAPLETVTLAAGLPNPELWPMASVPCKTRVLPAYELLVTSVSAPLPALTMPAAPRTAPESVVAPAPVKSASCEPMSRPPASVSESAGLRLARVAALYRITGGRMVLTPELVMPEIKPTVRPLRR